MNAATRATPATTDMPNDLFIGGQWRPGTKFPWDITIVDNSANTDVPLQGDLKPTFA